MNTTRNPKVRRTAPLAFAQEMPSAERTLTVSAGWPPVRSGVLLGVDPSMAVFGESASTTLSERRLERIADEWEIFLQVTAGEITHAAAARKSQVDVPTIVGIRRRVKDAALRGAAGSAPGDVAG